MRKMIPLVYLFLVASVCVGDVTPEFKSITARNARLRYLKDVEAAAGRYAAQVETARETYMRALKVALTGETKAGNLDEANKIQAVIVELEQGTAKPTPTSTVATPSGRWKISYREGNEELYSFDGAQLSVTFGGKTSKGRVFKNGDDWYVDMNDRDTNRITVVGDRIFIEHWRQEQKGLAHTVASGARVQ